jgi:hypothetical protein
MKIAKNECAKAAVSANEFLKGGAREGLCGCHVPH